MQGGVTLRNALAVIGVKLKSDLISPNRTGVQTPLGSNCFCTIAEGLEGPGSGCEAHGGPGVRLRGPWRARGQAARPLEGPGSGCEAPGGPGGMARAREGQVTTLTSS